MPYTLRVQDYQTAVAGNGGTISPSHLDALDALVLDIEATPGLSAKIKELHIPAGDSDAAPVRLWYKAGAQIATLAGYSPTTGASGQCASGCAELTDFDYTSFASGVLMADGFAPSDFAVVWGGNSTNFNAFSYDWDRAKYNRVVGPSLCLGPDLNANDDEPLGETMMHDPAWSGFLAASGGASEHFLTRDGEVIHYRETRMGSGSMDAGTHYLPFANVNWHASFVASYLTRAEMATLSAAIRSCITGLGRSNVPPKKTRRLLFLGDSRTYTTQVSAFPYAETFYKQAREALGWAADTADVWDYGINGRKIQTAIDDVACPYPGVRHAEAIGASRPTGPRQGRLCVVWDCANDLLTTRSAAQAKADLDTALGRLKTAGWCPIVISEPIGYGASRPAESAKAVTFNAACAADAGLVDGTKAFALVRLELTDLDPDDSDDSFDGVHLTEGGTAKVVAALAPVVPKVLAVPTVDSAATSSGVEGTAYTFTVTVDTDLSIGPYTFHATGLPAGLSINASTGVISGTPTGHGVASVSIWATNDNGESVAQGHTLTVTQPVPVITSGNSATRRAGVPLSFQVVATQSPSSYAATGLPAGLSLHPSTGLLSGTVPDAGTYTFSITASNTGGSSTPQSFTLNSISSMSTKIVGDPNSFLRLSGKAFAREISPQPANGYVHLGNIIMYKIDPKVEDKVINRYEGAQKVRARTDVISQNPEFTIEGDEYYVRNMPLIFNGRKGEDLTQDAVTDEEVTLNNVVTGLWYPLGFQSITELSAVKGVTALEADVDYQVDLLKGMICFLPGGAVSDNDDPVVTLSAPARTYGRITAFNTPKRVYAIKLYGIEGPEDIVDPNHRMEFTADVFTTAMGDFKVEENAKFSLRAAIRGTMEIYNSRA